MYYVHICIYTYHPKKENKYMDPSIFGEWSKNIFKDILKIY